MTEAAVSRTFERAEAARAARVAVIDVGSNSVRLVVYDHIGRTPLPLYNERLMCGLGRDLGRTGRLDPEAVGPALATLRRFAALADAMGVERIDAVATAAVREAADGADFVDRARASSGLAIRVLSGAEEARYSALGVLAAAPNANGLMADLGGGSLELVLLADDEVGDGATLPLGPLRFDLPAKAAASRAAPTIGLALASVPWLTETAGRDLYVVGGAWRALGHMHMQRRDYPLHVLHGYEVEARRMRDTAEAVAGMSPASLKQAVGVSKERLAMLPLAAQIMSQLIQTARPGRMVFSAYGLREGLLYDKLPAALQRRDPLLAACSDISRATARFPDQAAALLHWTDPLFAAEGPAERRLREAAACLADIGWRTHPDYRAEQAFFDIVQGPIVGLDHNERARLALMIYARYTKQSPEGHSGRIVTLMSESEARHARQVGLAFRLALTICGGEPGLLGGIAIARADGRLRLTADPGAAHLLAPVVERRLEALARAMELDGEIVV